MNIHENARLTPRCRKRTVRQIESGRTREAVAKAAGVCPRTARRVVIDIVAVLHGGETARWGQGLIWLTIRLHNLRCLRLCLIELLRNAAS